MQALAAELGLGLPQMSLAPLRDAAAAAAAPTLVLAPPACLEHRTAPEPILRGGPDPPPENVRRLLVLTDPGVCRSPEL